MKTAPPLRLLIPAVLLTCGMIVPSVWAAEEASAVSFVVPTPDRQCDEFNRSWKVANKHSYLSIKLTIRWHAVGAKQMQEEFILAPGAIRGIGCAPSVEIVSAELMQF